jgi:phosphatidylserine/phosphatidylglycerophosphate/cardiolipin synthase-like enzyme
VALGQQPVPGDLSSRIPRHGRRWWREGLRCAELARVGKNQNVADQLPEVAVHRARTPEGCRLVNHAKFVIIDRTLVLSTSANFSRPAENTNIEFGLLVEEPELAAAIEETMRAQQGVLYELVPPTDTQMDST